MRKHVHGSFTIDMNLERRAHSEITPARQLSITRFLQGLVAGILLVLQQGESSSASLSEQVEKNFHFLLTKTFAGVPHEATLTIEVPAGTSPDMVHVAEIGMFHNVLQPEQLITTGAIQQMTYTLRSQIQGVLTDDGVHYPGGKHAFQSLVGIRIPQSLSPLSAYLTLTAETDPCRKEGHTDAQPVSLNFSDCSATSTHMIQGITYGSYQEYLDGGYTPPEYSGVLVEPKSVKSTVHPTNSL